MHLGLALGLALAVLGTGSPGLSQESSSVPGEQLAIQHTPPECMDTEVFPLVEAHLSTPGVARRVTGLTIRFRAEDDTGWYEVPFRPSTGGVFQAALPRPLPEAVRVMYYITTEEPELRSPEYLVPVLMGGCPGARSAPPELAEGIRVRRTSNDQTEIPKGFSPEGIRPPGPSSRTTLGIVAGAAAGGSIAALVIPGDEPVAGNVDGESPEALRACFTPDPIPDIDSGDTILFDASCTTPATVTTYQWNFGDGTSAQGSSVEHRFIPGGVYTVTLSVSEGQRADSTSRLVRVIATPSACFITIPNPPRIAANESINFNAECSLGDRDGGPSEITRYEWDFGDSRPGAEGRFVSRQFPRPDVYGVRLTVTNEDGRQDTNTQFVVVETQAARNQKVGTHRTEVSFMSQLELPQGSGSLSAQISLNESEFDTTTAASPRQHQLRARPGENVIEGRLLSQADGPGRWRFDFRAAVNFVPQSLRVDSGDVLTLDSHSVVFRVTGDPGPPIRFRFRLDR